MSEFYLSIGPNCWGKDTTIDGAKRKMRAVFSRSIMYALKPGYPYVVYRVGEHAYCNEMGGISYYPDKGDPEPVKVEERKRGDKKPWRAN